MTPEELAEWKARFQKARDAMANITNLHAERERLQAENQHFGKMLSKVVEMDEGCEYCEGTGAIWSYHAETPSGDGDFERCDECNGTGLSPIARMVKDAL